MAVDESGTAELLGIRRALASNRPIDRMEKVITITGVIQKRSDFRQFRDSMVHLKERYWPGGVFNYKGTIKRVCFHSREIRKREGPFRRLRERDYTRFLADLSELLEATPSVVIASSLDKELHVKKYWKNAYHPYTLCMDFILERFSIFLNRRNATGIVLLESRGRKEDAFIHRHIMGVLREGTRYMPPTDFRCIKGVYFNPKWNQEGKTFVSLELADLFAYPIHQYVRDGVTTRAFKIVEKKFDNFPKYLGYGLKIFPEK